ncbi:vWA domain-containing protein [Bdellovibrio sp. HCB337]|uniref:vWA domain-containing protein n=1 Tax=Bdellovibrio sp. HCB337 TaxID=3394358 RepID=UPI0039A52722
MKLLLSALILTTGIQANAVLKQNFDIQKFPGKVKIEADINISEPVFSALDVLFVIDNSGSMATYQQALATASRQIDKDLSQVKRDFHIGIISTDVEGQDRRTPPGKLTGTPNIITSKSTPGTLANNLVLGTHGSASELPFQSAVLALSEPMRSGANAGFLRPGAPLALVFLTDADDQSAISTDDFKNFLGTVTGDINKVTAFSWVIPTGPTPCNREQPELTPVKIEDLTKKLNGEVFDICGINTARVSDFSQKLANFGFTGNPSPFPVADITEVPLTITPDFSTIEVRYGTQVLKGGDMHEGWIYDSAKNAVILGRQIPWSVQAPGTKLEVSFVPADWTK